ncbi:SDR family oxidoreductase [Paenibacillus sp. GCM10027626]|uniref:SDR family oxidoreductase n=1 Tax=Paenibacillus sp. GCM10027626 TaxID=3273411 RepID=UPI0036391750
MSQNLQQLFSLEGCVAIVTGGAGYLGSAIVEGMLAYGAKVAVADISAANTQVNERQLHVQCDVSSTASIREMMSSVEKAFGGIHVLINCATFGAGYGKEADIVSMSDENWLKGLDGAAGTAFRCIREVIPYMERAGGGAIVNFGSMYGIVAPDPAVYGDNGYNNPPNYGAGKAAVLQLTRYCAANLAGRNIRVNSITPGPFPNGAVMQDAAFIKNLSAKTMLGRVGKREEMIGAAVFLASGAASYITGSNIVVDGGWTAW